MRIPLDYYRVLGLPIQATEEQLQQAHRDRTLQLPRREYSEAAIAARKQLIDEAYAVIANPEERQAYDTGFLARTYGIPAALAAGESTAEEMTAAIADASNPTLTTAEPYTPTIDIADDQLIGALVILQELGEYELVIRLGRPYLSSGNQTLSAGRYGDASLIFPDLVLTMALACLELGREQWQQGRYENAAESLDTGRELLQREQVFETLRGEIQADLFKLRPYQVLELLALPETRLNPRRKGLKMLQAMLQERGGIDGRGNDQSGLDIDDFLRFIQQLRSYLTAAEQQTLFEAEARRPSAVANYLAVYALLARGFAQQQPNLIRRAKQMLGRLSDRQDVHLEQAVCALLLGQTEEASHALELSQEYEPLAFIREHSQGSPDLLPGLCLYAERWLQQEVFPHFRDLANGQASLRHYFADEHVQAYLEALPAQDAGEGMVSAAAMPTIMPMSAYGDRLTAESENAAPPLPEDIRDWRTRDLSATAPSPSLGLPVSPHYPPPLPLPEPPPLRPTRIDDVLTEMNSNGQALYPDQGEEFDPPAIAAPPPGAPPHRSAVRPPGATAAYVSRLSPEGQLTPKQRGPRSETADLPLATPVATRTGLAEPTPGAELPRRSRQRREQALRLDRLGLLVIGFLLVTAGLGFGISRLLGLLGNGGAPMPAGEPLMLSLNEPLVPIPVPGQAIATAAAEEGLTAEQARQVIERWFSAKQAAFGPDHNVEPLSTILTEPELSQRRARAQAATGDDWYWGYEQEILNVAIAPSGETPNQAVIEAEVREKGDFYRAGLIDANESYDSTLQVRYSVVKEGADWRIQAMEVIE